MSPRGTLWQRGIIMKYYLLDERDSALAKAIREINERALFAAEYRRGFNDCAALLAVYDGYLRGAESRAWTALNFEWKSAKGFLQGLYDRGYTVKTYFEYCGYEIISKQRPWAGDVGFSTSGAHLYDGINWVSTHEDNSGIIAKRFNDPRMIVARPVKESENG